jgi:hypothetical protein
MPTTPPGVPELLSVGPSSPGVLVVSWVNNTNNEAGFDLMRRKGSGGTWATIATPPRGGTAYVDRNRTPDQRYDYRVRAVNAAGKSAWSNVLSGTPTSAPAPPPTVPPGGGNTRYVAVNAGVNGLGTMASPCRLQTGLGTGYVLPGETLFLRGGTYKTRDFGNLGAVVRLAGTQAAPIHIKPYPGERVTIDGGLRFVAPTQDVWLWDMKVIVSEPRAPKEEATTDDPRRQWGGVNLDAGPRCKLIGCLIRDCCQGISAWKGATDLELNGCVIWNNGWEYIDVNGNDNSTGYAIYAQNEGPGWTTIRDCLLLDTYSYTLHLYGEAGGVDNFLIEGNVIAQPARADLAIVGGMNPSKNIRVLGNWFVNSKTYLGYLFSERNENLEARNNLSVGGRWEINDNWRTVTESGNVVVEEVAALGGGPRVLLRVNRYDPARANLAVLADADGAHVDLRTFLQMGQRYRLLDPRNMWGAPVREGVYSGPVSVPLVDGFGCWVVFKTT